MKKIILVAAVLFSSLNLLAADSKDKDVPCEKAIKFEPIPLASNITTPFGGHVASSVNAAITKVNEIQMRRKNECLKLLQNKAPASVPN